MAALRKCARGLAVLRNLPPFITVLIIPNLRVICGDLCSNTSTLPAHHSHTLYDIFSVSFRRFTESLCHRIA